MVRIESKVNHEEGGCNTTCEFRGTGIDIINEVLCVVESAMKNLKSQDPFLHATALKMIADTPSILTGEDTDDVVEVDIQNVKVREGVN